MPDPIEFIQARRVLERAHYEIVNDQIVDDPYLGAYEVWIASRLVRGMNLDEQSGRTGCFIRGALFVLESSPRLWRRPDIAFVSNERWPDNRPVPREEAWDVVPDLAVEIVSPADTAHDLMTRLEEYFRAGVRLVWVVYPDIRKVYAYDSTTSVRILQRSDELFGEPVLPGFRFPLTQLFETEEGEPTPIA